MESDPALDPDPLVRGTDPHQNVTDPQHWKIHLGKDDLFPTRMSSVLSSSSSSRSSDSLITVRLLPSFSSAFKQENNLKPCFGSGSSEAKK
jgi:hypothetical protein